MLKLEQVIDEEGKVLYIKSNVLGQDLLTNPKLNKGSAFSHSERRQFHLMGKLPYHVETIQQQVMRIYQQYSRQNSDLAKHVYLRNLHDTNETLFYKLVSEHLHEMLPIIYTPTISTAVEQFSLEFRRSRGLYIAYPDREHIDEIIDNRLNSKIDIIVMTDGEAVLGIGDQGIGGINICIAKLMVYVICGGANPHRLLPIQIDVGTNNPILLNDPMYLGWRHPRLVGTEYDDMIARVVAAIQKKIPYVYLHWEDFGRENARRNLQYSQPRLCTFNDDMQGTGAVTLAALLTAIKLTKIPLAEQRIVIFGAGTAGTGIADQLCAGMMREGLSKEHACSRLYLVDKQGLLNEQMIPALNEFQRPYACHSTAMENLATVVRQVKPTVLIGCSGQNGSFTETIVKTMAAGTARPIIFPLSNPTEKAEATPAALLHWTNGRALIATGSPFPNVEFHHQTFRIAQCNNALIYPGIGLGIVVSKAAHLSDAMLWKACQALSNYPLDLENFDGALLPDFFKIQQISKTIALAVAEQAYREGVVRISGDIDFSKRMESQFWLPQYYDYQYCPNL